MNNIRTGLLFFALILSLPLLAQENSYDFLVKGFKDPPANARPKAYWWCLNGNIDTVRAKEELLAMKNAGISGFDIFEIGVPKGETMIQGGPAFMSDESLIILKSVIKEAGRLELTVGLNLASSWNAGGSWIKPQNAGKSLYFSKITLNGSSAGEELRLPFPDVRFPQSSLIGGTGKALLPTGENARPAYYEEIAVLAIPAGQPAYMPDTSAVINISSFFDHNTDILRWSPPPGSWDIYRYVCSNSGQELVMPSPHSAGLTIDHFDSVAVEYHLNYIIGRLQPILGDFRSTALKSFYLASYEARGFVWTSSLPAEFRKLNGYDITKYLPLFHHPEIFDRRVSDKVLSDFKKTLSELMINNLYRKAKEICNNYGLMINCEAGGPGFPLYNGPAEPLKALGSLDIPRGEFWVGHSRYYRDKNGKDSIDILRVVKEVAAASHIYGRRIVEQEAFTSFRHWMEGPGDIKPMGDRAFCEGMNRVVLHGFSHNPRGSGLPGYAYNAGTHFNDKRVWWPKSKPFFDYLSRCSFIFQETDFVSDVLYYYGDRVPNSATPKNTHFTAGPGYDYEVINTDILVNELSVKDGRLILPGGASFRMMALEEEEIVNPEVLLALKKLAEQGAVIIGEKPLYPGSSTKVKIPETEARKIIDELWYRVDNPAGPGAIRPGKIYSGVKSADMLRALDVPPDIKYQGDETYLIDFIHYRQDDIDFYFLRNTEEKWISRNIGFRNDSGIPELWDPLTGEIIGVSIYRNDQGYVNIPVTLPPNGTAFFVFRKGLNEEHYTDITTDDQSQFPPLLEYTRKGTLLLKEGKVELNGNEKKVTRKNVISAQVVEGPWDVSFQEERGAPGMTRFNNLISWTDSEDNGIKYFSGVATYENSFSFNLKGSGNNGRKVFLDLGSLFRIGEVWLNGTPLGVTWTVPHRYDITDHVLNGKNILKIEIANSWSNRITGDALTGSEYTNTNITTTAIPGIDLVRFRWAEVPLLKSGLLGPVIIETIKPVIPGQGKKRGKDK